MKIRNSVLILLISFSFANATQIKINFKHLKISKFIEIVAEVTEQNILVDKEIKGEVNFYSNKPLEKEELLPLLSSVLRAKKMALVYRNGFYQIVSERDVHY